MAPLVFTNKKREELDRLGVGCFGHNNVAYGLNPREESIAVLNELADRGRRFFDTADMYGINKKIAPAPNDGWGETETRLAEMLKGREREAFFLATKAGRFRGGQIDGRETLKAGSLYFDPDYILRCFTESLERLETNYIDLFQLHGPEYLGTQKAETRECFEQLQKEKQAGRARYIGVSVGTPEEGVQMLKDDLLIDSIQVIYHLLAKRPVEELFALAKEKGVRIIVREPLARGFLAGQDGKYTRDRWGDWTDFSSSVKKYVQRVAASRGNEEQVEAAYHSIVEQVEHIVSTFRSAGREESLSQLALAFCLAAPEVSMVIPGITKKKYIDDILGVLEIPPLSQKVLESLNQLDDV